jgi:hypothetical protein
MSSDLAAIGEHTFARYDGGLVDMMGVLFDIIAVIQPLDELDKEIFVIVHEG